jgi:hypothetical protein
LPKKVVKPAAAASLKFKHPAAEQEGISTSDSPAIKQIQNEKNVLTNELILLNRELARIKQEYRLGQENLKKVEKENYDKTKSLQAKDTALDKVRKEREELWTIVNTDKYKSVRGTEQEREKVEQTKVLLEQKVKDMQQEMQQEKLSVSELESTMSTLQFENERQKDRD